MRECPEASNMRPAQCDPGFHRGCSRPGSRQTRFSLANDIQQILHVWLASIGIVSTSRRPGSVKLCASMKSTTHGLQILRVRVEPSRPADNAAAARDLPCGSRWRAITARTAGPNAGRSITQGSPIMLTAFSCWPTMSQIMPNAGIWRDRSSRRRYPRIRGLHGIKRSLQKSNCLSMASAEVRN